MDEQEFYAKVAELLDTKAWSWQPWPYSKRTRWNNRDPGNGRFPGHGMVRWHGASHIHVALHNPVVAGTFSCPHMALAAIDARCKDATMTQAQQAHSPEDTHT